MTVHARSPHVDLLFQWGSSLNLLAANNSNTVLILCEHLMSAHYSQQMAAVQLTPTQLSVAQFSTGAHLPLLSDTHIKGVCASKVNVLKHATRRKERGLTHVFYPTNRIQWQSGVASKSLCTSCPELLLPLKVKHSSWCPMDQKSFPEPGFHWQIFRLWKLPLLRNRLLFLRFPSCSCAWWEPLHRGTKQGADTHTTGLFFLWRACIVQPEYTQWCFWL